MILELASQEESWQRLIVRHIWNIISSKFLLFSIHSSCWMEDAKFGKNVYALEFVFGWRASLNCVCITIFYVRIIFH